MTPDAPTNACYVKRCMCLLPVIQSHNSVIWLVQMTLGVMTLCNFVVTKRHSDGPTNWLSICQFHAVAEKQNSQNVDYCKFVRFYSFIWEQNENESKMRPFPPSLYCIYQWQLSCQIGSMIVFHFQRKTCITLTLTRQYNYHSTPMISIINSWVLMIGRSGEKNKVFSWDFSWDQSGNFVHVALKLKISLLF